MSVTISLCAMRRIALYISLVVLLVLCGCSVSEHRPVEGRVSIAYLRSLVVDSSTPVPYDLTISGYVVANDRCGELSRAFVIADESGGVEVKVDAGGSKVDALIPLYSHIEMKCSGLCLGREERRVVLGAVPTDEYVVDRIDIAELLARVTLTTDSTLPPEALSVAIGDISYNDMFRYVILSDIELISDEHGLCWCDRDISTDGYITTARHFTDGRDTIVFVNSGECSYAKERITTVAVRCIGIVDSYDGSVAFRISNYQIEPMAN